MAASGMCIYLLNKLLYNSIPSNIGITHCIFKLLFKAWNDALPPSSSKTMVDAFIDRDGLDDGPPPLEDMTHLFNKLSMSMLMNTQNLFIKHH